MGDEALPPVVFDEDNPEWTESDFARARPAEEVLPPEVLAAFGRPRQASPAAAEQVSVHIDRDVFDRFRAGGPGWQARINEALRRAAG